MMGLLRRKASASARPPDNRTDMVIGRLESVADRMEQLAKVLEVQLTREDKRNA